MILKTPSSGSSSSRGSDCNPQLATGRPITHAHITRRPSLVNTDSGAKKLLPFQLIIAWNSGRYFSSLKSPR